MTQADLANVRQLAKNGQLTYSEHATDQMFERGILLSDVEGILCSKTNQIIETQSPSARPGKQHKDERILISDPQCNQDIIVIFVIQFVPLPELRIVTVEYAEDSIWIKDKTKNPWLDRKPKPV